MEEHMRFSVEFLKSAAGTAMPSRPPMFPSLRAFGKRLKNRRRCDSVGAVHRVTTVETVVDDRVAPGIGAGGDGRLMLDPAHQFMRFGTLIVAGAAVVEPRLRHVVFPTKRHTIAAVAVLASDMIAAKLDGTLDGLLIHPLFAEVIAERIVKRVVVALVVLAAAEVLRRRDGCGGGGRWRCRASLRPHAVRG
jgi:hypothetical protein